MSKVCDLCGTVVDRPPAHLKSTRTYCSLAHYWEAMRINGERTRVERFWANVTKSEDDGCWEWTAGLSSEGYGEFWYQGVSQGAHRFAYEVSVGSIPEGLFVCHRCDNPPCVRPDHLFLGTHGDNVRDAARKGRLALGKLNGAYTKPHRKRIGVLHGMHKLTEQDVRIIRELRGLMRQRDIAKRFGIYQGTVSAIQLRKNWSHVN